MHTTLCPPPYGRSPLPAVVRRVPAVSVGVAPLVPIELPPSVIPSASHRLPVLVPLLEPLGSANGTPPFRTRSSGLLRSSSILGRSILRSVKRKRYIRKRRSALRGVKMKRYTCKRRSILGGGSVPGRRAVGGVRKATGMTTVGTKLRTPNRVM